MALFYFDERINDLEHDLDLIGVLKYLDNIFQKTHEEKLLNTILASSWFYYVEGDVNQVPQNYDYKEILNYWKKSLKLGLREFSNNLAFCFIAGYICSLHWHYLEGDEYEKIGNQLINKALLINGDERIRILVDRFVWPNKGKDDLAYFCKELFPNNSFIDGYFREIIDREFN